MAEKHSIADVVRVIINPDSFSALGQDTRCCHVVRDADGKVQRHEKRLLRRLWQGRGETHYAVYLAEIPTAVGPWTFEWSEGVSKLGLKLEGRFRLQVTSVDGALALVDALGRQPEPGDALHRLIGARLHTALTEMLEACDRSGANLLSRFEGSGLGDSESRELNQKIAKAVQQSLEARHPQDGGIRFEVRFTLRNGAPLAVAMSRSDSFRESGSAQPRTVDTTARVELTNFQAFRKSGLEGEEGVRREIESAIQLAVQHHLFGKSHFELVEGFRTRHLLELMSEQVGQAAGRIGFKVSMFQTAASIPALKLLQQQRIEIGAKEEEFYPASSTGAVQFKTTLLVRLTDGRLLNLLLSPEDDKPLDRIKQRVLEICRDNIRHFDRRDVNLHFADKVEPKLCEAIRAELARSGIETLDLHLRQERTEDGERHEALCSMTVDFSCTVTSRGQTKYLLPVVVKGRIQPRGTSEDGWEQFESQDYGFRKDSKRSDAELRQFASESGLGLPAAGPLTESDRRNVALRLELHKMRECVEAALKERLAAEFPDLPADWQAQREEEIRVVARDAARLAVQTQFGMTIELHGFGRDTTMLEEAQVSRTQTMLELAKEKDLQAKTHALQKQETVNSAEVASLEDASAQLRAARSAMTSSELRASQEQARALLKQDGVSMEQVEDLMSSGLSRSASNNRLEGPKPADDKPAT